MPASATSPSSATAGACLDNHEPATTSCEDGNACTSNDTCGGGVCNAGGPVDCDDGQFCTGVESCDPELGCQAGTPPSADDGVACTDDSCDEVNDLIVNTPNDANCSDGTFCNGAESCDPVDDCQPGSDPCPGLSCDDEIDACVDCVADSQCDDGAFCNGVETCDAGVCQAGTPPLLDDGVPCTDDTCDEVNDLVVNTPNDANCDNGLFCDGAETCDPVDDCQAGSPPVIDDGVACTDDSCDEANDFIVNAPNDAHCDNGLFCDGAETCDPVDDCQAGSPPVTDDGVACTDDSCDEVNDLVVNAPNDANCDNGDFCDGAETCDPALDCQPGDDPCPGQSCDESDDACVDCLVDADCDDGAFCNGAEVCNAGACEPGTPPVVDDGVACTDDSCDEDNDAVVNAPNDAHCDNGLFCDGAETCDVVNDCQPGSPPAVDDGVGCTDDGCDEVNDLIVNAPNHALCDNGLFCDGLETCDAVNDCQAGLPPSCADDDACTQDTCNEDTDSCDHDVDDDLVLSDTTLVSGEFVAPVSITAGPALVIDGPVQFVAGAVIRFVGDVEIGNGFSAETRAEPCP
jgi:hypothetical protein